MTPEAQTTALRRIAEIDDLFASVAPDSWGSWMVAASREREHLINLLNHAGHPIPHSHLARTTSGHRVS